MLQKHGDIIMSYHISHTQQHIEQLIFEQIRVAFIQKPSIAGTFNGLRHIHQGCFGRRTSLFPSCKAGGSIASESFLELGYALQLEAHPSVQSFRTQALKIPIGVNQDKFPDFLIRKLNGSFEVREIKPSIEHLTQEQIESYDRLKSILESIDIHFKIIDANSLPSRESITSLLLLYSRGHCRDWKSLEITFATDLLKNYQLESLEQAYSILNENGFAIQLAEYLLFHGKISIHKCEYNNHKIGVDI